MISRLISTLAMQRPNVSVLSLVVSIIGLISMFWVAPAIFMNFFQHPDLGINQFGVVGFAIILFIIIRSMFSDILNIIDRREKIEAGTSVRGSRYDFWKLFDKRCTNIFIVGQNLRTLLYDPAVLARLSKLLAQNQKLRVTIILALPSMMEPIDTAARPEIIKTVEQLIYFYHEMLSSSQKNRVMIRFHPGAMSLSAMIRDPDDVNRGVFVFTPKWATDREPGNRIFCILRKWKNPTIFNKLYGHMEIMTGQRSSSLENIATELGIQTPVAPLYR